MRRLALIALLSLVACGDSAVDSTPEAPPGDVDTRDWVDRHIAGGWFPEAATAVQDEGLSSTIDVLDDVTNGESGISRSEELDEKLPRFGGAQEVPEEDSPESTAPTGWQRSTQREGACRLSVGDDDFLPLDAYQATVRIDGFRARVVLDLVYSNPYDETLEGRFKLRLPDGAAVHYLAFGDTAAEVPLLFPVNDSARFDLTASSLTGRRGQGTSFRAARMVPREQAQRAYAAETAQEIDPALLEWSGSGVFDTRVFPILPSTRSRVTVGYDVDLARVNGALGFTLNVPEAAAESSVDVQCTHPAASQQASIETVPRTAVSRSERHSSMHWEAVAGETLAVWTRTDGEHFLAGEDVATGPLFATRITPHLPSARSSRHPRAVFVLDTSMSMDAERMLTWTRLMERMLVRNRAHLREFAVLFFNVETWWWRPEFSSNDAETVAALMQDVRRLALEGATDLGAALREAGAPHWARGPVEADTMLFSDGVETWGIEAARDTATALPGRLYCYTSRFAGSDTRSLAALARATDGAVFRMTTGNEIELDAAAEAHLSRPLLLRGVRIRGCTDVVLEGNPTTIYPGQTLRIAGRGRPSQGDPVILSLAADDPFLDRELEVPLGAPLDSPLTARVYGQIATGTLEALEPVAGDDARAYALHFGVTGATCSLLMLEDEAAYERYEIVPADDAAHVRVRTVDAVLTERATESARVRGNARDAFLAWLDRIERTSGVTFDQLDAVRDAARSLPPSAFEVDVPPLLCKTRTWDDLTRHYRRALGVDTATYDVVYEEAEGRASVRSTADGIRALSSLVEADPGSTDLLRDVAFTVMDWDAPGQAIGLLRRVVRSRPHEPETYRALAECLVNTGNVDAAILVYEIALRGVWSERFGAFRLIAAMDYLRLLRRIEPGAAHAALTALVDDARVRISAMYLDELPALAVTLTWNTDRTDIDLHVVDPSGVECSFEYPRTPAGGAITRDVTAGYGPELFLTGRPLPGEYVIKGNYYGSDALRTTLRSRCYVTIARHAGTDRESVERTSFVLADSAEMVEIGRLVWESEYDEQ